MIKEIERRIAKLEGTQADCVRPTISAIVPHGTKEEMDAFESQWQKDYPDRNVFFVRFVPAVGESINDFRITQGLEPMNIPGWD